ncbi:MAG: hypothetical protein WDW38_006861 [Sanguina aurantia]
MEQGGHAQGTWLCPSCESGKPPNNRPAQNATEKFLFSGMERVRATPPPASAASRKSKKSAGRGKVVTEDGDPGGQEAVPAAPARNGHDVSLGRIIAFVRNRAGDGCVEVALRYYCRPEDSHNGRTRDNNIRDVLLTQSEHYEPLECLWEKATVVRKDEWDGTETSNVFFCDYAYDSEWKVRSCAS